MTWQMGNLPLIRTAFGYCLVYLLFMPWDSVQAPATYTTPESLIQCSIHLACSYLLMMLKYIWEGGRTHWTNGWGMHADFGAALDSRKPFYISKEVIKNSQKNHDSWIMVVRIICCIICGLETILSYNKEEDDSWLMFLIAFYTL